MHVMPHFLHSELASEYESGVTKRTSVYVPASTMADCRDCLTKLLLDWCVNERQICGISA